jgi:hypothetical protein
MRHDARLIAFVAASSPIRCPAVLPPAGHRSLRTLGGRR